MFSILLTTANSRCQGHLNDAYMSRQALNLVLTDRGTHKVKFAAISRHVPWSGCMLNNPPGTAASTGRTCQLRCCHNDGCLLLRQVRHGIFPASRGWEGAEPLEAPDFTP